MAELSVQVRRVTNLWSPQDAQQQSRDRGRDMPFVSSLSVMQPADPISFAWAETTSLVGMKVENNF